MKTIPVKVVSARKLTDKQLKKIKTAVENKYKNATVQLNTTVDKSVIGGVKLLINTVEYDATVKGKLDKLQAHLAANL